MSAPFPRTPGHGTALAGLAALFLVTAPAAAGAPDYARVVRDTPGLLVHYRFEEARPVVSDASGRGRDGRAEGPGHPATDPPRAARSGSARRTYPYRGGRP